MAGLVAFRANRGTWTPGGLVTLLLVAVACGAVGTPARAGLVGDAVDFVKTAKKYRDNFDDMTYHVRERGNEINGVMDQVSELADKLPDPKKKAEPDNWMKDLVQGEIRKLSTGYIARTFQEFADDVASRQIDNVDFNDQSIYPRISMNDLMECRTRSSAYSQLNENLATANEALTAVRSARAEIDGQILKTEQATKMFNDAAPKIAALNFNGMEPVQDTGPLAAYDILTKILPAVSNARNALLAKRKSLEGAERSLTNYTGSGGSLSAGALSYFAKSPCPSDNLPERPVDPGLGQTMRQAMDLNPDQTVASTISGGDRNGYALAPQPFGVSGQQGNPSPALAAKSAPASGGGGGLNIDPGEVLGTAADILTAGAAVLGAVAGSMPARAPSSSSGSRGSSSSCLPACSWTNSDPMFTQRR